MNTQKTQNSVSSVISVISEAAELWTSELFAAGAGNTSNGFPALTYRPGHGPNGLMSSTRL